MTVTEVWGDLSQLTVRRVAGAGRSCSCDAFLSQLPNPSPIGLHGPSNACIGSTSPFDDGPKAHPLSLGSRRTVRLMWGGLIRA
jgi:hypothetical protein